MDASAAKEHSPALVLQREGRAAVHGAHRVGRLNARLAVAVTRRVGSMWAAYAFALLALISLPAAIATGEPIVIVAWIAQTFLQLVLLPIVIVGQNVQAAASDARATADHATLNAVHALTADVHTINERQSEILERLDAQTGG
jgi:hypothetical protein